MMTTGRGYHACDRFGPEIFEGGVQMSDTAAHEIINWRLLAVVKELREIREVAHSLPSQHVNTRTIHADLTTVINHIRKNVIHSVWVHSKQHRRASGR